VNCWYFRPQKPSRLCGKAPKVPTQFSTRLVCVSSLLAQLDVTPIPTCTKFGQLTLIPATRIRTRTQREAYSAVAPRGGFLSPLAIERRAKCLHASLNSQASQVKPRY
jgi:hypothetical protein